MRLQSVRPQGYTGRGDKLLAKVHRDLNDMLRNIQKTHHLRNLDLPKKALSQIAGVLVEFAEDVHNDIGMWRSYEHYNLELFGTPLPFTLTPGEPVDTQELYERRIHHLLWVLFPEFDPGLILSPTHPELSGLSKPIGAFLTARFADIPQDSGVKQFLDDPVQFGWDVKRKLVWLGTRSYLFRDLFRNYVAEHDGKPDIPTTDDFICQETTTWSGLGVIDILAVVLNITKKQRRDLRSWYERHLALFQVKSTNPRNGTLNVRNLMNDRPYQIRVGDMVRQFKARMCVIGSVVPWNGEWYWSGGQSTYPTLSKKEIQQMKHDFSTRMSGVVYRYCDDLANEAKKRVKTHYDEFLKYHGSDLVVYPDGLAVAEDMRKQIRAFNEAMSQEITAKSGEQPDLDALDAAMDVAAQFRDMEHGVGVYFNPDEGQELMEEFDHLMSGLEKKGINLNEDEEDVIRGFIFSDAISPGFVKRVVREYGDESLAAVFFIKDAEDDLFLEYLLRRYKGHFYRTRYPALSIVG